MITTTLTKSGNDAIYQIETDEIILSYIAPLSEWKKFAENIITECDKKFELPPPERLDMVRAVFK